MTATLHRFQPPPIITGPQIVHGLPVAEYHARKDALSNSGLRDFARSPLHYYARHEDPDRPPEETKPSQLAGSMMHCALLEPGEFQRRYPVGPASRRGTKLWDAFEAALTPGQVGVKPEEHHQAFAQAQSMRRHPEIARLLSNGRAEVSAFAFDEATGLLLRCRPDWVHTAGRGVILMDAKGYSDVSGLDFARQVARQGYDAQAAFYCDVYEQAAGIPVLGFVFAGVEVAWPYAANALMLDDESMEAGRRTYRELLPRFAQCRRMNSWPGYGDGIELIATPQWARAVANDNDRTEA